MTIRPFKATDAATVARLHRDALPRAFLSTLGDNFLGSLYALLTHAPKTCIWVATNETDRCQGFIAGSLDVCGAYRHVLSHGFCSLTAAVLPSLLRPGVLAGIGQTLTYPWQRHRKAVDDIATPDKMARIGAELLSLAVAAEVRGHGLGRQLVAALEDSYRHWGYRGPYRVVTEASDTRSNAFYASQGFTQVGVFHHHRHAMALYKKYLPGDPHGNGCAVTLEAHP